MSVRHTGCPKCPSSDALAVYDDGHAYCYVCKTHIQNYEETEELTFTNMHLPGQLESTKQGAPLLVHNPAAIPKRHIKESTCRTHGYGVTQDGRQVANYCDSTGAVVAQKVKSPGKKFTITGSAGAMTLWQQHRFSKGGRKLLITEGETDLLCWQSLQAKEWPAVSLPNGTGGAKKAIQKNLEYVESFDEVILYFDADEAGRLAAQQVSDMLPPGKCKIAQVPSGANDICDAVQQGMGEEVIKAFWEASIQRPDGIVGSKDILQAVLDCKHVESTPYPWSRLNEKTHGMRMGELVTLTAGTGIGKSQVCRALAVHLIRQGHKVGYVSLEESLARTGFGLLEQVMGKPLHLDRKDVTDDELKAVWAESLEGRICVFNHFGSMDAENLLSRIRFMRIAEQCDFIFVDHLSILVSGWGDGDERRLIDNVMTALRSTVQQTGCGMILVSHLKRLGDKARSHEEGGEPRLSHLRGSQAIAQLSDITIGLSRDQHGDDPNLTKLTVLKNRFSGLVGKAGMLRFDPKTGLLAEDGECPFEAEESDDF